MTSILKSSNKKIDSEEIIKILKQANIVMLIVFKNFGEGVSYKNFLKEMI